MQLTFTTDFEKIAVLVLRELGADRVCFVVNCDDGRLHLVFGDYYEKSRPDELLTIPPAELARAAIDK